MLQELTALTSLSMKGMVLEQSAAGSLVFSPQLRHLKLSSFDAVPALWRISTLTNLVELELTEFLVSRSSVRNLQCSLAEACSLAAEALWPLTKLRYLCFKPYADLPALPRHVAEQQLEGIAKTICGQDGYPFYVQRRLFAACPLFGVPPKVSHLVLQGKVNMAAPLLSPLSSVHYWSKVGVARCESTWLIKPC